jgi:hypothetical protein
MKMGRWGAGSFWAAEGKIVISDYSCLCGFWPTIYFTYGCLYARVRSCPIPDSEWPLESHRICQQKIEEHKKDLSCTQAGIPFLEMGSNREISWLLYGNSFEAITDNNPLIYVLTSVKLDATGQRCLAILSNYNFILRYLKGINNADADSLSRGPSDSEVTSDVVHFICNS